MTSITPRIIITALAVLALAVPAASAMPLRDNMQTSSLAGTTSAPRQDLRNADNRGPRDVAPVRPAHVPSAPAKPVAADDGGTSPLVYILPGLVLVGMLGAAFAFARTPRRSPA